MIAGAVFLLDDHHGKIARQVRRSPDAGNARADNDDIGFNSLNHACTEIS